MALIVNGQTITTGTWLRCLKVLNPKLRVCSFEGSNKLAGLYLINRQGEWEDICGVDKQFVPPYATFDDGGHIIKSGWRRVMWILLEHGYTTREQVKKVCNGFFDSRARAYDRFVGGVSGDPISNKMLKWQQEKSDPDELLTTDQILELGKDIQAKDTPQQIEEKAHDKWFLEKWKENGGGVQDRPQY
jgi:hypothetical protein